MGTYVIITIIIIGSILYYYCTFCTIPTVKDRVKELKSFLGLDFQSDYTVIEYKYHRLHGDFDISISVPDESFKKIMTFLESVNIVEETIFKEGEKHIYRWSKNENENIFVKTTSIEKTFIGM